MLIIDQELISILYPFGHVLLKLATYSFAGSSMPVLELDPQNYYMKLAVKCEMFSVNLLYNLKYAFVKFVI